MFIDEGNSDNLGRNLEQFILKLENIYWLFVSIILTAASFLVNDTQRIKF